MSISEGIRLSADLGAVGAIRPIELPATKYAQGGRVHYQLAVPVIQVLRLVQQPDPAQPIEGNRKVDASRAKKFATYLRREREWVCPAILSRVEANSVRFRSEHRWGNGTEWGILEIPLELAQRILLLDGQHRVLGFYYAEQMTNAQLEQLRHTRLRQVEQGQPREGIENTERQIALEEHIRQRLLSEHVTIEIVEVRTERAAQMFADINNNAKGVNPDYTTYLDQRDVVNRITIDVIKHPLLDGNVEIGQAARMSTSNENLIGLKSVADLVRSVLVGNGRVGARVEDELERNLSASLAKVKEFLDTLVAGFSSLSDVAEGRIRPAELREFSMLGSSTMLRVLAAVHHDLTKGVNPPGSKQLTRADVEMFFRQLEPLMKVFPTAGDTVWMPTKAFIPDTRAPQARQGSIKSLTDALVEWARTGATPSA